ncbi:MAG: phospho-N-acetylmuramoyl-pentapeptide-transferase [Spirochaetes bacterium]|nr:MAG: phospho-N-acetylmuramoyl-pentapeptide-transferase [Spirochaetota bacterium]
MLREFLLPLVKYFSPLNIFRYLTFRSAYAAVTALLIVYLFGPTVIARLRVLKFGQSVRADGPQSHLAKTGTGDEISKVYVPFIKSHVVDLGPFWILFAVVYVTAWSNAVNITDGLDGLATGLVIMALVAFSVLTYVSGRADWSAYLNIPFIRGAGELTVFNLALLGACIGFLWFNAHPAEVFMGDSGSLALGGVMGVLSLIVKKELLLLIIGGVFVMELGSVMLQVLYFKATKGKRLFRMAPIHHHFELSGLKETKVVTRFWILGAIFALLALTTLKIQ